jgi:putative hydrolase of the HAD superfamily
MLSPNGIRAILFDLDGTLRLHHPIGSELFTDYAIHLGLHIDAEDRLRAARWEHYYFASSPEIKADNKKYAEQKSETDSFWKNFGRRRLIALGCHPAQAAELAPQLAAYMHEAYKPQAFVQQEAHTALASMKEAGFILGMVSNRTQRYEEELTQLGLSDYFQFTLAGGEVDSYKPEPAIFAEALRRAGTSASETMYVGDNYFADIVGSRRAGLRPVLYDPIHLFPDADCPVVTAIDQLIKLL